MEKVCWLILLFLVQKPVLSQDVIAIGSRIKLYSNVLKEDREIWIHLPDKFERAKPYSVAYLLDGEINFHYFSTVSDFLFRGNKEASHQLIVVGIINTQRTRDLTPTKSFAIHPKNQQKLFEDSGGADAFLGFLTSELKPYIARLYPHVTKHIFIGHSFGGLAVIDCLLKYPDYFDCYIANDPSLWWDNGVEAKLADAAWKGKNGILRDKKLFLSHTDMTEPNHFGANNAQVVKQFSDLLSKQMTGLVWKEKTYPGETHGTISLISNIEALRFLFQLN